MGSRVGGEVEIVRSSRELKALAVEWESLALSLGLPMLSHTWVLACAEALYEIGELHIITVRLRGSLVGVAPLVAIKRAGARYLELAGASYLYEPSGLLYRDEASLAALTSAVVSSGFPVVLARIPAESPLIPQIRSIVSGRGVVVKGAVGYTLSVPISSGWKEYVASLSSRRRYDLRRARQRAEEGGAVTVRVCSPSPEEVEEGIAEFVRIEATGWKGRNGSSLSQRTSLREFFLRYAALASRSGTLRLGFLDVAGTPIAAQISVIYAERLWVLKIGYDEAWSRCSPGSQLLAETMKYAFGCKLKSYEFLGSDEPWLHGWATERRGYRTIGCYPATLQGLYGLAADTVGRMRARAASLYQ